MSDFHSSRQQHKEVHTRISIPIIQRELANLSDYKPHTLQLSTEQIGCKSIRYLTSGTYAYPNHDAFLAC